ncbi:MAG: hypothetical protein A2017_18995 [Lentisphaerae bacterium GWF2_44_16]|nr:MAG: hypothetical protein A2017_18995 [Lentisphaerae bacterium GWF2_44_16]
MSENRRLDKTLKYNAVAFVFSISIILLFVVCMFLRLEFLATLLYFLFSPIFILLSVLNVPDISPPLLIFLYWFFIALIFMIVKDKYRKHLIAVIFVIGLIYVISFCFMDKIVMQKEHIHLISHAGRLNQIGVALKQYSMDNGGYFPDKNGAEGFEMLRKNNYLTDYKIYTYPSVSGKSATNELKGANISVHYRSGEKYSEKNTRPVAWNKYENRNNKRISRSSFSSSSGKNYGNVLLANGSVIHYEGEAWKKFCEENDLSKK